MRFALPYGVDGDDNPEAATSAVVLLGSAGEGIVLSGNLLLAGRKGQQEQSQEQTHKTLPQEAVA